MTEVVKSTIAKYIKRRAVLARKDQVFDAWWVKHYLAEDRDDDSTVAAYEIWQAAIESTKSKEGK